MKRLRKGSGAHRAVPTKPIHDPLATNIRQVVRNLVVRHDGVVEAMYRLGPARWDYTGLAAQRNTIDAVTDVWALLAGHDMRERITARPYPYQDWARRLDARTPHPLPDKYAWADHLEAMQRRIASAAMDEKIGVRAFSVGEVEDDVDLRSEIMALRDGAVPSAIVRKILAEEKRVRDAVAGAGWRAKPMSPAQIGWLHQRSLAPGMPTGPLAVDEDGWDAGDVGLLANDVRWDETQWDRHVEVHGWVGGREHVRAVQVLTCARLDDLRYPECGFEPWQAYAERAVDSDGFPFAVEWNIVGRIATGEELAARATLDKRRAISTQRQYEDFDEPPPAYTERGIIAATRAEDEITTGQARDSSRFLGTINLIVSGEAVVDDRGRTLKSASEVVEERADAIRRLFAGNDLRMQFTPQPAQAARLREAVPGEPFDTTGYQRQIRLDYLAAGLPNVSTSVGDRSGPYIGYTRGAARRPVMHDPHFATEGRGALGRGNNAWAIVGSLGSGKSVLADLLAYHAARRGIRTVVRDPSGPMMALCTLPELQQHSTAINLLKGASGILNVPALVREPQSVEFADLGTDALADFMTAQKRASAERSVLVTDVARRMLDHDLYEHPATFGALRDAARTVGAWTVHQSLWDLVDALARVGGHGTTLAHALTDASDMPVLSLLFPPRADVGDFAGSQHASTLTVISTPGIKRAPDSSPRNDWSPEERAADVVLRLTALYTDRELFGKARSDRAVAIFDEAEDLTDSGIGRGYLSRLGRDHSKWNIAVYLALKSLSEEILSGELRNFLAGAFIGRQANLGVAQTMLDILNVTDPTYAHDLMRLSDNAPGEFVHLDAEGNVGGIRVDVAWNKALHDVVLTNPTPEGSEAWRTEEMV